MFQPRPLPRTLDAALRDLNDRKPNVRRSAVSDLVRLARTEQRQQALSGLLVALRGDEHADVRADAALGLADSEARTMLDEIVQACQDAQPRVRQMALLALGELSPRGHKDASAAVEQALSAAAPALRFQALIAARRIHLQGFEQVLERALVDEDAKVRYLALRLMEERWPEPNELPQTLLPTLESALGDDDRCVRVGAAILLAPSEHHEAKRVLASAVNDAFLLPAPEDQQAVIEMIGELGIAAAERGLVRQAWGRFGLVPGRFAWQAKVALARLGHARAKREILRGLGSGNRDARTLAVAAAGRARLSEARAQLQEMSRTDAAEPDAIAEALRQLRQLR